MAAEAPTLKPVVMSVWLRGGNGVGLMEFVLDPHLLLVPRIVPGNGEIDGDWDGLLFGHSFCSNAPPGWGRDLRRQGCPRKWVVGLCHPRVGGGARSLIGAYRGREFM